MIKGLIAPSVVLQTDQEMMEPYKHLPSDVGNDREKTPNRHFPLPSSLSLSLAIFVSLCFSLTPFSLSILLCFLHDPLSDIPLLLFTIPYCVQEVIA